jgi:aminoglycoside phosphotransferase (APT) family kinase protein
MPAAEVEVDEALVQALLEAQHPDLAGRTLRRVADGWDNAIFRVGDDLLARLPRRELAVSLVENEHRWLPELAPRLPLPIPAPVRTGGPGQGYPWPWSICPWFDGASALETPPEDPVTTAEALGGFLRALHRPAPPDAPRNPYRGIPLADRTERTLAALEHVDDLDRGAVRARWEELVATPPRTGPALWLHGDVHPGNLLVAEGRLRAVLDFGDLTSGDPASDLAVAWMLFPPEVRPRFRAAAGDVDDATWRRARGWALALGLVIAASSADNPSYAGLGARTIAAVMADPD